VDDRASKPSRKAQAKAELRKILDRLNSIDTGASRHDMEQEERGARDIDMARKRERRPDPGGGWGGG
jgi:hypothetical protein